MATSSRAIVDFVLLGPTNDRRQLQDSPILGDVWIAFASRPAAALDLLVTPYKTRPAGPVAFLVAERVRNLALPRKSGEEAHVAYLQGLVAARLFFREVLRVIVPMTSWWRERRIRDGMASYTPGKLRPQIDAIIKWAQASTEESKAEAAKLLASSTSLDRYVALAGLILWASTKKEEELESGISGLLQNAVDPDEMFQKLDELFTDIQHDTYPAEPQIWQVSLNRKATAAIEKSVPAVKGDAARSVFRVKCDGIAWAVIDSGIDGDHPALRDSKRRPRVVKHFDFSDIRRIVSLDNARIEPGEPWLVEFLKDRKLDPAQAAADLRSLADDANNDRPIHWELVEKFITIEGATPPHSGHGTHVAGIIGASAAAMTPSLPAAAPGSPEEDDSQPRFADGMCPDIRFYDFRVLSKSLEDTEFAIIAALQYIRYLNERHSYITIHGANLSLSIPHDVRNFACGRTPVCNECERLVDSGVTVVAAAGNLGYHSFETKEGSYEGYSAYSITDPGNADGVITVGATHRFWPHTYGVSFFSSRGPTGDGRMKPDLVAPGERIRSCLPEGEWGELDGTSMAAPHVSGAAAMLMARYSELIAQPREIKRILCESATDLGRERNFQGHGMLDVLRAFQKV